MASGNVDNPEGGLDALIQVAACEKVGKYIKQRSQLNVVFLSVQCAFFSLHFQYIVK